MDSSLGPEFLKGSGIPEFLKGSGIPLPTLFDEALRCDLAAYKETYPEVTFLQYEDDLLLAVGGMHWCL